tara:strand:+ start:317 stop:517 length:201 start_codon:yes stop_codon:yes gene_type:complete
MISFLQRPVRLLIHFLHHFWVLRSLLAWRNFLIGIVITFNQGINFPGLQKIGNNFPDNLALGWETR